MSEKNIENVTKSDSILAPPFVNHHVLPDINFIECCLINNIYIPKKVINLYISHTITITWGITWKNYLFGSVKLTNNSDSDKYKYSGYGIGFDSGSEFLFIDGSMRKNVIIFRVYMSSSADIDNKGKNIFGKGPTQGLDDTTLTAEAIYPINFTQPNKRFPLSPHYDGSNSFLFVNATSKQKNS